MTQETINQRIKFLVDTLSPSARAFSEAIQESPTNTFNYIGGRLVEPRAEYLAKMIRHFGNISAHWLLTGEGEPFLPGASEPAPVYQTQKKVSRSLVVGHVGGNATQNQESDASKDQLIEQLRSQLADKERTIQILLNQLSKP